MLDSVKKPHDEWRGALRKERFQVSHDLPPASPALAQSTPIPLCNKPPTNGGPSRETWQDCCVAWCKCKCNVACCTRSTDWRHEVVLAATVCPARAPHESSQRPLSLAARCMAASFGCIPHGARLHRGCVLRVCVGARGMSCWAQAGPAPCSFHLRAVPSRTPRGPRGPDNLRTHAEMAPGGQQPRLFRSRTRQKYLDFSTDERF